LPKYNSIDTIPAKVFFSILQSKNYQDLKPKPNEKSLEEVFIKIYDDFFIKSDNHEANEYLRLTKEISFLEYKIANLKQSLHFYFYNQTTKEMRIDFIEALKEGYDIEIDIQKPFIEEVHRVLTNEIGIIENDLSIAKASFEGMTKKSQSKGFDYYEQIGALSNVLTGNSLLKEDMTLAIYVSLEKLAQKVVEQNKKKK
jgi:hypothetical protein